MVMSPPSVQRDFTAGTRRAEAVVNSPGRFRMIANRGRVFNDFVVEGNPRPGSGQSAEGSARGHNWSFSFSLAVSDDDPALGTFLGCRLEIEAAIRFTGGLVGRGRAGRRWFDREPVGA
jgi:hypothetical protein